MLVLNLPFKALMFLTLMRPSLVLFLVLWLKLGKDFLKVRCRLALLPFLISCLIWLDLVASLPLIKERILVIILLLHFLSFMLGSVLVLMLLLLVFFFHDSATTEIYTLSLHDALPISRSQVARHSITSSPCHLVTLSPCHLVVVGRRHRGALWPGDADALDRAAVPAGR